MNLITRNVLIVFIVLFKYSSSQEIAAFSKNIQRVSDGTGYLLLTPSRFLSGTNNRICISKFGQAIFGTGLAQIEILPQINTRLDKKDFNYVRQKPIARTRNSFGAGNGGCFEIMIPKSPYSKVWLHLRMRLDDLPNYRINAKREVYVQHESTLVVIQTNKPIFRAGETIRFRVLQLKPDLTPSRMPIASIAIETPSELFGAPVCVAQWNNVSTQMGLIQLDFKLDKYASKGDWRISVKSNHLTSETFSETFYVTDYVLPKFHIIVMHQKNLLLSFKQIVWNICARYFYGEPVKGTIHIRVSSDTYDLQPISKLVELDNARGCYNYSIRTKDLGFTYNPRDAPNIVIAEIGIKEQGSKTWQNTTAISQVVREVLKIDFINKNKLYLRPGIPYKSKVKVTDWNSNPVLNAKVQFCRTPTNKLNATMYNNETEPLEELEHLHQRFKAICDTVYTDSKGLAQSSFVLPNELRARYLKMTAMILSHPLREYEFGLENKSLPTCSLYMTVWSSLSSIHMDIGSIVLNPTGLKPGTKHMLPVYISYEPDKEIKAPTLHFVVVTRSGIIFRWGSTTQCPVPADESIPPKTINYNVEHDTICYSAKESGNTGLFKINIPIKISHQMCPYSHVMTYFVHGRELVVANKYLKVSDCFYHKVLQQWIPDTVPPSTPVRLQIISPGPALCATTSSNLALKYAATHHSVQALIVHILKKFMDTRRNLTEDELLNDVCFRDTSGFRPVNNLTRSYYRNTLIAFKSSSIEIVSDLLPETKPCPEDYCAHKPPTNEPAPLTTTKYPKERSYFPETWLWDLHLLYSNGTLDIKTTAPDQITRYESQVFCLSRSGIATSHPSLGGILKVFQPFFVELIVPQLVKREEEVEIYYRVYNYMDSTIAVSVSLQSNAGATINIPSVYKSGKIACLAPKAVHTEYLMIKAEKVGVFNISVHAVVDNNIERFCSVAMPPTLYDVTDKMVKTIHVEPEGFKMEIHKSALLCSDGSRSEKEITWRLDRVDAVPNSEKLIVSIVGDVAGQMSVSADKLLSLPMGCGEQNMALLAFNLVALDYLAANGELTNTLRLTALNNLMIGYQRQLSYHHSNGAFSAFGPVDQDGSTWLTAFTLKYLHRLQQQWDIGWNPSMMTATQDWLLSMQMENGCFRNQGQVFHREMKGGLRSDSSNVALAAYIMISLVDADVPLKSSTLQNALFCLTALKFKPDNLRRTPPELGTDTDLIYTFVLSTLAQIKMDIYQSKSAHNEVNSKNDLANSTGETGAPFVGGMRDKRELSNETIYAVKLLQSVAKRSGDLVWWEADTLAVSIETTSYGILCLLALGEMDSITHAVGAVKWLSNHRSRKGGFVSTQDTLIALEAISAVSKYLPHISYGIDIALTGPSLRRHFAIRPKDRYDLNTFVMENLDSQRATSRHRLKVQARGSGCVMVQATQSYNTLNRNLGEQKSPFVIYSKMTTDGAFDCKANTSWCKCAGVLEICLFWSNPSSEEFPEMAIMEIELPTAYGADKTLLYQLIKKDNILLRRIEMAENPPRLIFYLAINSLQVSPKAYECYNIFLIGPKLHTAPSFIKVYDYYHSERNVSEAYTIPEDCPFNGNRRPHNEPLIDMVNSDNLYGSTEPLNSSPAEPQPTAPHPVDPPPTETTTPKSADPLGNFHSVDSDMDLEFPEGMEGPIPQIVKAPSNFNWDFKEVDNFEFADDKLPSSLNSPTENQTWTQMYMDMEVPEVIEGNLSVWLPENFTSAHTPLP